MNRIMLVTLLLTGCTSHKPIVVASSPSVTISDFKTSVIKALPTWDNDALAPYERQELDAIYQDLYGGVDEEQLRDDWQRLEVLDKALKARLVL